MSNRLYSAAFNENKSLPVFQYLFDPIATITGSDGQISTGAWRYFTTADISNTSVSISGLNLSVGAVDVTGAIPIIESIGSGNAYLAAISGELVKQSGTYTPTISELTGGQTQIPAGIKSYSIIVESGNAYINGVAFNAISNINGGGYNGQVTLLQNINVGCTGGRVLILYES